MVSRIAFIVNYNQYESKIYFTKKLSEALQKLGVETTILKLHKGQWTAEVYREIRLFDPDFTCSYNSFFSMKGYPWDFMQVPHLAIMLDPAFYSADLVKSNYILLSSVDKQDCKWLQDNGFNRIFFWPHATEKIELSGEERIYDVVFLGTFIDFEAISMLYEKELSEPLKKVLKKAIDLVLSDNKTSLIQALAESFHESKLPAEGVDFKRLFFFLDNYTRGKDRFEAINSIQDAKVHIFGEPSWSNPLETTWFTYLNSKPNIVIHKPLSYPKSFQVLKQSKICLNSMPFFKYGSHERIFNGLACGSLPLTMDNLYVRENFVVNGELLTYTSGSWQEINATVSQCLHNEKLRQEMAEAGRKKVLAYHNWDQRAKELLTAVPPLLARILPAD